MVKVRVVEETKKMKVEYKYNYSRSNRVNVVVVEEQTKIVAVEACIAVVEACIPLAAQIHVDSYKVAWNEGKIAAATDYQWTMILQPSNI